MDLNWLRRRESKNSEQNMYHFQPISPHSPPQWSLWVLVLLLLLATILWVFSGLDLIRQTWATALNAVFTGLSTIIAVAQWHAQMPITQTHAAGDLPGPFTPAMTNTRKGAIIVYTPGTWRGMPIHLLTGLHEISISTAPLEAISTVVEDRRTGRRMFICSFPLVPPGHYTLVASVKQRSTHITVRRGLASEIDWRY